MVDDPTTFDPAKVPPPSSNDAEANTLSRHRDHLHRHTAAIVDAARAIKDTNTKLKDAPSLDAKMDLHAQMDTHVAQLTLAVNNAVSVPDALPENTGGAADTRAVPPDANDDPNVVI